ncbi:hypothetical protein PG2071B_0637 [Bifidobacterium pseudolongum subsp. globosum]|uniref:Uncharacterized protein n=1 Tax=Bifidobacterium pseudolongum subsp. globosum TaxID=1690 RepID=A0A4Q5A705_9BIFI|nr:hypothetical protein PG2071B_0637 [Bifidobacterium pseudolongum subsp. globosum]
MKSKTRKLLATVAVLGSLFGFTGIAQAYEVYGKGVVYLDYSMATSVPYNSQHYQKAQYPDGSTRVFWGAHAATYHKSSAYANGLPVIDFGANFY